MSDLISKAEVLETYAELFDVFDDSKEIRKELCKVYDKINKLPSVQPEIIYCKDCRKHNHAYGHYYDGTFVGIADCCPLIEIRGRARGHEFDYQYCVYAGRRQDATD